MESATVHAERRGISDVQTEIADTPVRMVEVPLEQYRLAFERNPHPMWVFDVDTLAFIAVNDAAINHYGYSREEFLAMTIADIRPPEDVHALAQRLSLGSTLHERYERRMGSAGIWRHRTRDGTIIDVEISSHELAFAQRRARVVLVNDVTARQRAENAQRAQLAVAHRLAETATVEEASVGVLEALCMTLEWDAAVAWTVDHAAGNLRRQAFWSRDPVCIENAADTNQDAFAMALAAVALHRVAAVPVRSGEDVLGVLEFFAGTPRTIDDDVLRTLTIASAQLGQFLTRKQAEQLLAHQALHDPLTGLPNRTLLLDRLEVALAHSRRHGTAVATLFLDVDNFKVINDSLGHSAGDEVLRTVATRIRDVLGPGDTVARFGGDEFVVIADQVDRVQDAVALAERISSVFSISVPLEGGKQFVSTSIGIAISGGGQQEAEDLIRDADAAMYRAKELGPGRYEVFDEGMHARVVGRLRTENDLRDALRSDELCLFYQPIVELPSRRVVGVEALVRWNHPEHGLLVPDEFISVAEESGLILPIGVWVLTEACRQAAAWQRSRPHLPPISVSVNVSPIQISHGSLADTIEEIVRDTHVDPSLLNLELTENALIEDPECLEQTLVRLKALGVQLVLDDFGTGYSAFGYLSRFPIDALKIDRSFVAGITTNARHRAIVQAMIDMADALGIEVVAEGVETRMQMELLLELGCKFAQGFYFAEAAGGEHVSSLLRFNVLPVSSQQDQLRREVRSVPRPWRRLLHGVPHGRHLAAPTHST